MLLEAANCSTWNNSPAVRLTFVREVCREYACLDATKLVRTVRLGSLLREGGSVADSNPNRFLPIVEPVRNELTMLQGVGSSGC